MDILDFYANNITMIFEASPIIEEFIIYKIGIDTVSDIENSNLKEVFEECIKLLIEELEELGIIINDTSDITSNIIKCKVSVVLREMFDKKNINNTINSSKDLKNYINDYISSGDYTEDTFITGLIEFIHESYKLSLNWEFLNNNKYIFSNDDAFIKHIKAIMENDYSITENDSLKLAKYTEAIYNHVEDVKNNIKLILDNYKPFSTIDFNSFDFKNYDVDLSNIPLEYVDMYLDESDPHPVSTENNVDIDFIKEHKEKNQHHFDYYIANGISSVSSEQIILLFSENIKNHISKDDNINMFDSMCYKAGFSDVIKTIFNKLTELYFNNIGS